MLQNTVEEEPAPESRAGQAQAGMFTITTDLPDPTKLGKNRLVICVVGRVSTGKSSLVKAFFDMSPEDTHIFQVDAQAGTTKRASGVVLETPPLTNGEPPGKIVVFDLPGLHEADGDNTKSVEAVNKNIAAYLKKDVVDVGIFVVDGPVTDTIQEDYRRLSQVAKKVFLVFNKIDTLDYLKAEKREQIIEDARVKLAADAIFPTACKGFDPNADQSRPGWRDIRGIEELRRSVYSFVYEHKQAEFLDMIRQQEFWRSVKQIGLQTVIGFGVVAIAISSRPF